MLVPSVRLKFIGASAGSSKRPLGALPLLGIMKHWVNPGRIVRIDKWMLCMYADWLFAIGESNSVLTTVNKRLGTGIGFAVPVTGHEPQGSSSLGYIPRKWGISSRKESGCSCM